MLPSRGLRPHPVALLASRQSLLARSGASRKFSSIPRNTALSAPACRTSPLQSANWRTSANSAPKVLLSASSVRYGSWYAPWTWGRSNPPPDAIPTTTSASELAANSTPVPEPIVTTATPELAPAGIEQPAVVESASTAATPRTVEELLGHDSTAVADATAIIDPTAPISYWGNLKDLGLDYGWGPTTFFENIIELTYLNTSLGWVGSIAASTVLLRIFLFYFQVRGSDSMAKMAAMKPVLQPLMDQMEAAKRGGDDDKVQMLKMKQQAVMSEVGADLVKNLATPVLQGVLGFGAFRCLRGMSSLPVPGMNTDNPLWFHDLTVSDPMYLLPVVTGGIMYTIMKMGGETGMGNAGQTTSLQKQMLFVMPVVMTAVTCFQPAAVQLYFLCSAILGGTTAYALRQPGVRRLLKIRQLPTPESNQLYGKVIKGEVKLSALRGADGKIRYQAPNSTTASPTGPSSSKTISKSTSTSTSSSSSSPTINIKSGIALPHHMRKHIAKVPKEYADRDVDYDQGMPKGYDVGKKWDWVKRNYRPKYVGRWLGRKLTNDSRDISVIIEQERQQKAKQKAQRYELERKRRLEGR